MTDEEKLKAIDELYTRSLEVVTALNKLIDEYKKERDILTGLMVKVDRRYNELLKVDQYAERTKKEIEEFWAFHQSRLRAKLKEWEKKYRIQQSALVQIQDFVMEHWREK